LHLGDPAILSLLSAVQSVAPQAPNKPLVRSRAVSQPTCATMDLAGDPGAPYVDAPIPVRRGRCG
jgi:hypothetical protein